MRFPGCTDTGQDKATAPSTRSSVLHRGPSQLRPSSPIWPTISFQIEFHWDTAVSTCRCGVCDCLRTTAPGLRRPDPRNCKQSLPAPQRECRPLPPAMGQQAPGRCCRVPAERQLEGCLGVPATWRTCHKGSPLAVGGHGQSSLPPELLGTASK